MPPWRAYEDRVPTDRAPGVGGMRAGALGRGPVRGRGGPRVRRPRRGALAYLTREVPRWSRENHCYSCHNNGDAARASVRGRAAGIAVPPRRSPTRPAGWLTARGLGPQRRRGAVQRQAAGPRPVRRGAGGGGRVARLGRPRRCSTRGRPSRRRPGGRRLLADRGRGRARRLARHLRPAPGDPHGPRRARAADPGRFRDAIAGAGAGSSPGRSATSSRRRSCCGRSGRGRSARTRRRCWT